MKKTDWIYVMIFLLISIYIISISISFVASILAPIALIITALWIGNKVYDWIKNNNK